jgi:hypothetical protein
LTCGRLIRPCLVVMRLPSRDGASEVLLHGFGCSGRDVEDFRARVGVLMKVINLSRGLDDSPRQRQRMRFSGFGLFAELLFRDFVFDELVFAVVQPWFCIGRRVLDGLSFDLHRPGGR